MTRIFQRSVFQMASSWIAVACLALGLATGCGSQPHHPDGEAGIVQARFAIKADITSSGCPSRLVYPQVRSIRLRIFRGAPSTIESEVPVFDTSQGAFAPDGCLSFVQCAGASVRMDANDGRTQDEKAQACEAAGGVLVEARSIDAVNLATLSEGTAWFEAFSDDNCTERAFVGLRGGIQIAENFKPSYTLSPLCVGHFTTLPSTLDDNIEFSRQVALAQCSTDCDCIDTFAAIAGLTACTDTQKSSTTVPGALIRCDQGRCSRGYAFEKLLATSCSEHSTCTNIYSEATCDQSAGFCEPASYFPLEPAASRAFHTAVSLSTGHIGFVGGLTRRGSTGFEAAAVPVELFDPFSFTFQKLAFTDSPDGSFSEADLGRALHAAALGGGGATLAIAGGVRGLGVRVAEKDGIRQLLLDPTDGSASVANAYHDSLLLLDVAQPTMARRARVAPFSVQIGETKVAQPYAAGAHELVVGANSNEVFFAGGLAPAGSPATEGPDDEDTAPFANVVINCVLGGNLGANCIANAPVLTEARGAAVGACFGADASGACRNFALIGGARNSTAAPAEVFATEEGMSGRFVAVQIDGAPELGRAKFAQAVSFPSDGVAFSFGGVTGELFGGTPNLPTFALSLETDIEGLPMIRAEEVNAAQVPGGTLSTFRTHHSATTITGNRVLVAGGLDSSNRATAQSLIFEAGNRSYLGASVNLNRARFGHRATRIERGPLAGAVLITGGMDLGGEGGEARLVPVAEIYFPAP